MRQWASLVGPECLDDNPEGNAIKTTLFIRFLSLSLSMISSSALS
jgi:hypothetical protein